YDAVAGDPYDRWGQDMTAAGAAARLGGLVKGSFVGIRVTRHGSSPRILIAEILGTKGRARVTRLAPQHIFGALTTNITFTTTTCSPAAATTSSPRRRGPTGSCTTAWGGRQLRSSECPARYWPSTARSSCTGRSSRCPTRSRVPRAGRSGRFWAR